jgi:hypothetical protein
MHQVQFNKKMAEEERKSSVFDGIVKAILEPGVGSGVMCILNSSLLALLTTLLGLLLLWSWNVHIIILFCLTLVLFALINW